MPLKAPESYELDHPDEPLMHKDSYDDESDLSDIDEFDPLQSGGRR